MRSFDDDDPAARHGVAVARDDEPLSGPGKWVSTAFVMAAEASVRPFGGAGRYAGMGSSRRGGGDSGVTPIADELEGAKALMEAALVADDLVAWARADERFHQLLVERCSNGRLASCSILLWISRTARECSRFVCVPNRPRRCASIGLSSTPFNRAMGR